jgi:hypothetical protein
MHTSNGHVVLGYTNEHFIFGLALVGMDIVFRFIIEYTK